MRVVLTLAALLVLGQSAAWAEELPLDQTVEGRTERGEPVVYTFNAPGPGALTLVIRAENPRTDLSAEVLDSLGQQVPNGMVDSNYQGNVGADQGVVPIPRQGEYQVRVQSYGGRASFVISAGWLPFDALARPEDPDGSPATAIELTLDEWFEEDLYASQGDLADWFKLVAPQTGEYEVRTQASGGDLIMEGYWDGEYNSSFERSDRDLDSNTAKERIIVELDEGEVVYFKVTSYGNDIDYEIRATQRD